MGKNMKIPGRAFDQRTLSMAQDLEWPASFAAMLLDFPMPLSKGRRHVGMQACGLRLRKGFHSAKWCSDETCFSGLQAQAARDGLGES